MARICFLFNHDQTHQLAHSLPIALAMIQEAIHDVVLAVSTDGLEQEIKRQSGTASSKLTIVRLDLTSATSRGADWLLSGMLPVRKLLVYRDNLEFFQSFDALVVSEKSSLLLKTRYGLKLPIIHTRHGAGDRDIGFNRESAVFDLVLVAGSKIRDRLIEQASVDPDRIAIVGYSKFDLCGGNKADIAFADPSRPTVIYNPHPSPHLSSWYRDGMAVLRAFKQQNRYNLIFAPHVMLFARRWVLTVDKLSLAAVRKPDPQLLQASNIHADLGSSASNDMSYTNSADIYLGDVSSQIYEFLYRPRPCLFLNSHNVDWQDQASYLHWRAGPVIDSPNAIIAAVDDAVARHADYTAVQRTLLDSTFSVSEIPAPIRAAKAINDFLAKRQTT
jgi:hypothetical protein